MKKSFDIFIPPFKSSFSALVRKKGVLISAPSDQKKIKISISRTILKRHIQFVLNLVCENQTKLTVQFCDAADMQKMNHSFRGKDYPTDVLSFQASTLLSQYEEGEYLGDLAICLPVASLQAKEAKQSLENEINKLLIHGILHLKGFDHERNPSAERTMQMVEKQIFKELGHQHFPSYLS